MRITSPHSPTITEWANRSRARSENRCGTSLPAIADATGAMPCIARPEFRPPQLAQFPLLAMIILLTILTTVITAAQPLDARAAGANGINPPPGIAQAGTEYICRKDGMPMVLVPAGEFVMGSNAGCYDESPAHKVNVDSFLIDKHEVTNSQFEQFVKSSGYHPQGPWRRGYGAAQDNFPVRFVTWYDAVAYTKWAGRRLPTEAQWEKAAGGGRGLTYPWGMQWKDGMARLGVEVESGPVAVGSFPKGASNYGCLDMAGNVWEWVNDWYDRYYYQSLPAPARDPAGPADGSPPEERFIKTKTAAGNERSTRKVIRGGGWAGSSDDARRTRRMWANPRYWLNDTGFRCAVKLGEK